LKVKFLTSLAGLHVSYEPGKVYEIEKKEALQLLKAGYVSPVSESKTKTRRTARSRKPAESEKR